MPMRDQHRSSGKDERQNRLFLEREPGANADADGLDEIVPEFMHRDFYRSQEGELDAVEVVEPSGMLRAVRSESGSFRATSLRAPARSAHSEEPAAVEESLPPIRNIGSRDPQPEPLEEMPEAVGPTSPWPRPVETGGINLPLLLCLFFVVGLFMWREGTRPVVMPESNAPVPRRLPVTGRQEPATEPQQPVGQVNPQPGVTPTIPVAGSEDGDGTVSKVASEEQASEEDEMQGPPGADGAAHSESAEQSLPQQDAGSAAQRAAILERVSAGTVDRNERERRMEGDLQDTSLFPATKPQAKPQPRPPVAQPVAAQPAPKKIAEPSEGTGDLFPGGESGTTAVERPPAQSQGTNGKPRYQIAEPQL